MKKTKAEIAEITSVLTLVLENGRTVEVSYPDTITEEVWDEIEDHIQRRAMWWTQGLGNVNAMYLGESIQNLNMAMVVGVK